MLNELPEPEMRKVRGAEIAMIFQEPMTSLNPVFTIGDQIVEAIRLHQHVGKAEARRRAVEMLRKVQIPEPEQRLDEYPHQFSGGMRQRAMIAMALSCNPRLLIADEPTTALDVTIQAQILDLLRELQADMGMSILIITHDLGIIAEMADDVAVMYASKVVEYGAGRRAVRASRCTLTRTGCSVRGRSWANRSTRSSTRSRAWCPARCDSPAAASSIPAVPTVRTICETERAGAARDPARPSGPLPLRRESSLNYE